MKIELKQVFYSGNVIEYQVFLDGEYIGNATYYRPFKELRISVRKSEVTAVDGEIKEELSVIHEDDREIVKEIVKEVFSRFKKPLKL